MFSILINFFKSTVKKKLYLQSNLWYIISFVSQVRDHIFLIILNGHRRSSRSRKTFAMRLQGAPSIVKIRKSEGVIFSSLVQKILMESPEPEVRYIFHCQSFQAF